MSQSLLRSIGTLLSHEAVVHQNPPAARRRPEAASVRQYSTDTSVSELDTMFLDIMGSIRSNPELHAHVDTGVAAVAQIADDIVHSDAVALDRPTANSDAHSSPLHSEEPSIPATEIENGCSRGGQTGSSCGSPMDRTLDFEFARMTPASRLKSKVATGPKSTTDDGRSSFTPESPVVPCAVRRSAGGQSEKIPVVKQEMKQGKRKRYRHLIPSTHCHICCRPSRSVPVAVCGNITDGLCRKSVCKLCVTEYNLADWERVKNPGSGWVCCHCVDQCARVPRAQCFIYSRTNMKRKLKKQSQIGANLPKTGNSERTASR